MIDPFAARYAPLPDLSVLRDMSPAEIGDALLPLIYAEIRQSQPHGVTPGSFARAAAQAKARGDPAYGELVMEGFGFLERAGLVVQNPDQVGTVFVKLSRAGRKAATEAQPYITVGGQEAQTFLHPRIANAALGHLERGGKYLDDAAFAAFRELEVAVREISGLTESQKKLFYEAFKSDPRGPLIPGSMESGEVTSLREATAGCYGLYRNPPAHAHVHDDPVQTMRVLLVASTLLYTIEAVAAECNPDDLPAS